MEHAFLARDGTVGDQLGDVLLKGLRALRHGLFHCFLDTRKIAFFNQLGNQLGIEHDFYRRRPCAGLGTQQPLRDNGPHRGRQIAKHGAAHLDRIKTEDAVQRLVAVVGMHGGQAQVSGLRIGNRRRHGFAVPYLANQNNVRSLAQCVFQGHLQRLRIGADFALVDHGFLVGKDKFDGVLNRQDMAQRGRVAVVHHGGQCGALAGTGGPHHQQQATLFHNQLSQDGRNIEAFKRRDFTRNETHHRRVAAALAEAADPEIADAGQR